MSRNHLVRVGVMGHVGRFYAADATRYPRDSKVIVRTQRGLEVGEILSPPGSDVSGAEPDGAILRGMTPEDHLLAARLEKNKNGAFEACTQQLAKLDTAATLVDVEHLFDGKMLFFYFLGEVTREIEQLTSQLAEIYEAKVKFRNFTDAVTNGCGPNCGTEDAEGGCTSCVTCAVAGACSPAKS